MAGRDLKELFKKFMEICAPDLRGYFRVVRKARVVKTYASDGSYWADVQPLLNNEADDPNEPVISRVEIPVLWGGPERGVVCPPSVGTLCDLSYYDGDPNYPMISNFRWQGNKAPSCEAGAFIIQAESGLAIKIDAGKKIICLTPANGECRAGGSWKIQAPAIALEGAVTISAGATVTGGLTVDGIVFGTHKHGGVETGSKTTTGPQS